jgi:hypothetical protein
VTNDPLLDVTVAPNASGVFFRLIAGEPMVALVLGLALVALTTFLAARGLIGRGAVSAAISFLARSLSGAPGVTDGKRNARPASRTESQSNGQEVSSVVDGPGPHTD